MVVEIPVLDIVLSKEGMCPLFCGILLQIMLARRFYIGSNSRKN